VAGEDLAFPGLGSGRSAAKKQHEKRNDPSHHALDDEGKPMISQSLLPPVNGDLLASERCSAGTILPVKRTLA
jgi:hypothetical protein